MLGVAFLLVEAIVVSLEAKNPSETKYAYLYWAKSYATNGTDYAKTIIQTSDEGYIFAGNTNYMTFGGMDAWILKLNDNGEVGWEYTYGSNDDDIVEDIIQTSDGNYTFVGYTNSSNFGGYDVWIVQLDTSGNIMSVFIYGNYSDDLAYEIHQTADEGYIIVGATNSTPSGFGYDVMVLKLTNSLEIQWVMRYGGKGDQIGRSIAEITDGGQTMGYVVAATNNSDSDKNNYWIFRIDAMGNLVWGYEYGGSGEDIPRDIKIDKNGDIVVLGSSDSAGISSYPGTNDYWLIDIDSTTGAVNWQYSYGGDKDDNGTFVIPLDNKDFLLYGYAYGFKDDYSDYWALRIDETGDVIWQKVYGGYADEIASTADDVFTSDAGFILGGTTYSCCYSPPNYWAVKIDSAGNIVFNEGNPCNATVMDTSVAKKETMSFQRNYTIAEKFYIGRDQWGINQMKNEFFVCVQADPMPVPEFTSLTLFITIPILLPIALWKRM